MSRGGDWGQPQHPQHPQTQQQLQGQEQLRPPGPDDRFLPLHIQQQQQQQHHHQHQLHLHQQQQQQQHLQQQQLLLQHQHQHQHQQIAPQANAWDGWTGGPAPGLSAPTPDPAAATSAAATAAAAAAAAAGLDPRSRPPPTAGAGDGDDGRSIIRPAVTALIKEILTKPYAKGAITKEQFKTIAKKAVDKVVLAIPSKGKGSVPNTRDGLEAWLSASRKSKIKALTEGYVAKYATH